MFKKMGGDKIMIVDIDHLKQLKEQLNKINRHSFKDIIWVENGKELSFDEKLLDDWKYVGLNNCDFIQSGYYKGGFE